MTILQGQFFDGQRPISMRASMNFDGQEVHLIAEEISKRYSIDELTISPRTGQADRFIALPDRGQFICADQALLDSLPQESRSEGLVAWLEERWRIAVAGVALIAGVLLVGYFYGLPAAASALATRIPIETELAVGQQAVDWLDRNAWLKPTNMDTDTQKQVMDLFDQLKQDLPLQKYYQLKFRSSPVLGPNAFAFPGGIIVITDEMQNIAESRSEVMAVIAHEIGHVEMRHTLRSILQNSAVGVIAFAVTSDAASLSVAVTGLPVLLAQTKYSRKFESDADQFAFKLLKRKGYSPTVFASLMERIEQKRGKNSFGFLSTHPITSERIRQAEAAERKNGD